MGMLRRAAQAVAQRATIHATDVPLTSTILLNWLGGPSASSGVQVNHESAMGISAFWRGVSVLAGGAADSRLRAIDEETGEDTTPDLFSQPHPTYTWPEWASLAMVHRLLWGNAYSFKVRGGAGGEVRALLPLDPRRVTPRLVQSRNVAGRPGLPNDKLYEVALADGVRVGMGPREILHLPGLGYDGVAGVPVISILKESLGTTIASDRFAGQFFGRGTLTSGFLHTDKKLERKDAEALKQRWQEKVSGLGGAHEIAVLDAGAKYESLTIPPEQAQFLESREFNVLEMARITGVPPHLLMASRGEASNWGTGIEQQNIGLVLFSLRPHLVVFEARLTAEVLPRGERAELSTEHLTRGDSRARWSAHLMARKTGAKSVNEIRREEGRPPIDAAEADDPLWIGPTKPASTPTDPGGNAGEPTGPASGTEPEDGPQED